MIGLIGLTGLIGLIGLINGISWIGLMSYHEHWARAFAFTLAVELLVVFVALGKGQPWWRRLGGAGFAQLASHPAVWFIFPQLPLSYGITVAVAELWAVSSEVLIYRLVFRELGWLRALAVSALANGLSLGLGLTLRALSKQLGWESV